MSPAICPKEQLQAKAGAVAKHVDSWREISSDPWLLSTIQGVEIPFLEFPIQRREPRPYKLSYQESEFVDSELGRLLEQGVIELVTDLPGQVVSNIILMPKKDGKYGMIFDLTLVNTFV